IVLLTLFGLVVGTIGAFLLAKNIKNSLMGLEPSQITKLYNENIAMMDAIHEGILAVDQDGRVTIINDSAMNMLKIEEKNKNNIKGKNVKSVFPTSMLPRVLESGIAEYDKELITNDTIVVANRVPIISKGKIIGAIATFRDKTELTMLAEELTGVKLIIEALRANSHEFANKLHVILGLIKIGEIEEAKNYIINVADTQQQILSMIIKRIKDPTIAGLILGKFSRAKELGISIKIDKRTKLECKHKNINSNVLVTIIGNLIANALESVSKSDKEEKSINVRIEESESKIIIEVGDSGVGIKKENIKKIFERGFTDKSESRGIGLALVKENVQSLNGEIKVISKINKGTTFTIILPKGGTK
ncbi:MAG: ATP-binding protein, partial [Clostridia bacterium]|nr:ATP-binding protein [Clostridia bacterium]